MENIVIIREESTSGVVLPLAAVRAARSTGAALVEGAVCASAAAGIDVMVDPRIDPVGPQPLLAAAT